MKIPRKYAMDAPLTSHVQLIFEQRVDGRARDPFRLGKTVPAEKVDATLIEMMRTLRGALDYADKKIGEDTPNLASVEQDVIHAARETIKAIVSQGGPEQLAKAIERLTFTVAGLETLIGVDVAGWLPSVEGDVIIERRKAEVDACEGVATGDLRKGMLADLMRISR